jgi:hypothetical protein
VWWTVKDFELATYGVVAEQKLTPAPQLEGPFSGRRNHDRKNGLLPSGRSRQNFALKRQHRHPIDPGAAKRGKLRKTRDRARECVTPSPSAATGVALGRNRAICNNLDSVRHRTDNATAGEHSEIRIRATYGNSFAPRGVLPSGVGVYLLESWAMCLRLISHCS